MEFWGQEVKPGSKVSCEAGVGYVIHLSQAALGETKKRSENVVVSVKIDDKKLVLGTLSVDNHPQISCDLVFEKDFELSHSSKTSSVFLCGYKSPMPTMPTMPIFEYDSGEDEISSDEELEADEIPMKNDEIKKHAAQVPVKGKKDEQDVDEETSSGDDDFSDDSDSEMSEDDSSDGMSSGADLSDDSEDETEDSEEQTPTQKKPEVVGKKRAIEAGTPSGKKAKVDQSVQKTGDKKGAHVSTPYPAKSPKTPATDKKSKEKSPKSGNHACKSCSKAFGSEKALESHKKSKHQA